MIHLRRFTPAGLDAFQRALNDIKRVPTTPAPEHLLNDSTASEAVREDVVLNHTIHTTRLSLGHAIDQVFGNPPPAGILTDVRLWSWMSLFFFDSVCPLQSNGTRRVGAMARYILEGTDYKRYYRHLLVSAYLPYFANRDNPQRAIALLCQTPSVPGEIVEQIVGRQDFIANPTIVSAVSALYYDAETGRPKKGSSGKGPGTPRRLADVLRQFDRTWDIHSMRPQQLINFLPKEFSRFRPSADRPTSLLESANE